jgi:hypothetical protein
MKVGDIVKIVEQQNTTNYNKSLGYGIVTSIKESRNGKKKYMVYWPAKNFYSGYDMRPASMVDELEIVSENR